MSIFQKHMVITSDMVHFKNKDGQILPGVAPVAVQQGKFVARLVIRSIAEEK